MWATALTAVTGLAPACGSSDHPSDTSDARPAPDAAESAPADARPADAQPDAPPARDLAPRADAAPSPDAVAPDAAVVTPPDAGPPADPWSVGPPWGARRFADGTLEVRVRAPSATRLDLCLFAAATGESERLRLPMTPGDGAFTLRVSPAELSANGLGGGSPLHYGLRAFGPNWPADPTWAPGSAAGFASDVDTDGHRMNPNKLLTDPYALEITHDPVGPQHRVAGDYESGEAHRTTDTGPYAPKGIVVDVLPPVAAGPQRPQRPLGDEIVYEVHLRGLTMADPTVPENERGTYAGAARRAAYLRDLGVTAVEFLPLQETQNDQNELSSDAQGDNSWGYSTLNFFAPDRRYAADRAPGGPTAELRTLVAAYHAAGLKVLVDVVYNHTAEGGAQGPRAKLFSFRGLDNGAYYELGDDAAAYVSSNGVGPNFNTADPLAADLVIDSMRYWHAQLGVDGFRLDLASVVGNGCTRSCYRFAPDGLLTRMTRELPGVDLIAEPWGTVEGSYQIGRFPSGFAEWNDHFRDTMRRDLNRLGVEAVTPAELVARLSGSRDLFGAANRGPAASLNYVVSHDGLPLHDLFAYAAPVNDAEWPCGPSGGGNANERSWDHHGVPAEQRRAARTALALTLLTPGVPMIEGGDELQRTTHGNYNAYNIDSACTWLDWSGEGGAFQRFVTGAMAFRGAHPALHPAQFWDASVQWFQDNGVPADRGYLEAADRHFLAWTLDGGALGDPFAGFYVAYNGWSGVVNAHVPPPPDGHTWHLVADTGVAAEAWDNWLAPEAVTAAAPVGDTPYPVEPRGLAVFVAL